MLLDRPGQPIQDFEHIEVRVFRSTMAGHRSANYTARVCDWPPVDVYKLAKSYHQPSTLVDLKFDNLPLRSATSPMITIYRRLEVCNVEVWLKGCE